jgi:hypothetical protein
MIVGYEEPYAATQVETAEVAKGEPYLCLKR